MNNEILVALISGGVGIATALTTVFVANINRKKDTDTANISKKGEMEALYTNNISGLFDRYETNIKNLEDKVTIYTEKNEELIKQVNAQTIELQNLKNDNKTYKRNMMFSYRKMKN